MSRTGADGTAIDVLLAARRIADHARELGALFERAKPRATCDHLGAVLADSVLQAGVNYTTVVRPRVVTILQTHPNLLTISSLVVLIQNGKAGTLLSWRHREKVLRFESLVFFLRDHGVEDAADLRVSLASDEFCGAIQAVNGVGPKTVDYMACLIGMESIAVDRHVRTFARTVGVTSNDYNFLRKSFCCAADLLSLPRREFDAWLWHKAAVPAQAQLALEV